MAAIVSGLNQNVDVLGRRFHVQTEAIAGQGARISTTVFISGRVVAKREVCLDPVALSDDEICEQLKAHHTAIVENLLSRATALSAEKDMVAKREQRKPVRPSVLAKTRQPSVRPEPEEEPRLLSSLRVRRLLAKLRQFIVAVSTPKDDEGLRKRLQATLEVVNAIMEDLVFPDIRLDEQVRFFDLKERIPVLLTDEFDHHAAVELWSSVVLFATYLANINDRQELLDFDRRMLTWALDVSSSDGVGDDLLDHLAWCYGLDFELDRLIDSPEGIPSSRWREVMFRQLDLIGGEDLS